VSPNSTLFASRSKLIAVAVVLTALSLTFMLAVSANASSGGIGTGTTAGTGGGKGGHKADEPSPLNESSPKYNRMWKKVARPDKRWARETSECESGHDPDAIGGGGTYRGAFQFTEDTWEASPKTPGGDPTAYDYRTQAVVAVALKNRDGAQHWPVCG